MLIRARLSSATPVKGRKEGTVSRETYLRSNREPVGMAAARRIRAARPGETRNHHGSPNPAPEITADASRNRHTILHTKRKGASRKTRPLRLSSPELSDERL